MYSPKREDTKTLFKLQGMLTCLHSEFFVAGSLSIADPLVLYNNGHWHSYLNSNKEILCLEKGYQLFKDEKKYNEFSQKFTEYIQYAQKEIIPKYNQFDLDIQLDELQTLLPFIAKFWYLYGFTEFSYHELAYQKSQESEDEVLKRNLDDLGKLKFEGREILNAYMFEHGVLHSILKSIAQKFYGSPDLGLYLFKQELLGLYKGDIISRELLEERKTAYGCTYLDDTVHYFERSESEHIWNILEHADSENSSIKGTIAHKGTATGKAIIAPMLTNMDQVRHIDNTMQKGDILIAESTTPELMPLCKKAAAIVTDQGGMLSHAAIVSRELNVPCIIGTGNATKVIHTGDYIKVDAERGIVTII